MSSNAVPWAECAPGEEIVITGMSGMFPDSENTQHFYENLVGKVDLTSEDNRRWKTNYPNIPRRNGKLIEIDKFDAEFFGINQKQAETMDPAARILLEKTYEAIVDAGYNPKEFKGTNTGVFAASFTNDTEANLVTNKIPRNGYTLPGVSRAMLANRISFWLDVNGPSYAVDTACSSSAYALEHAYKAMRTGCCDAAIIASVNICLSPGATFMFNELGVLSADGRCNSFDKSAGGYTRSESIVVVVLQKKKDARRIYARVMHCKTNSDGYKDAGAFVPSSKAQTQLMKDFYDECGVNPSSVNFVEAHATGTQVGDPAELKALEDIFMEGREDILKIGSIKSNIGHTEASSALCSLVKILLSYESGMLMPNINLKNPRTDIESLRVGNMRVITEPTRWNGGLAAINSFGFGGANAHILLDSNRNDKINQGLPFDELPRLVVFSGRTEEACEVFFNDIEKSPIDEDFVGFLHRLHKEDISGHPYRGFTVLQKDGSDPVRSIKEVSNDEPRQIWFVYSGMGSQWPQMGKDLMKIPLFAESIDKCHRVLLTQGLDLMKILTDENETTFDSILNSFVGIIAIEIALTDLLKTLGVLPDGIVGHSVGEFGCAYADGCVTLEQAMLLAYYRGVAVQETEMVQGSMAAIGCGHEKVAELIPPEVDIACHNGPDNCTVSGPTEVIHSLVEKLTTDGLFAKEVNVSGVALHSRYLKEAGPKFLKYVKDVIPTWKQRSEKWISSTFLETDWQTANCKYASSEYFMQNVTGKVFFQEACQHVPENAIVIEIAPHGILQAILKRSLNENTIKIPLTSKQSRNKTVHLLQAFGKLFEAGLNPSISKLYPPIRFPVSRGTKMLSPLVRWDHKQTWFVFKQDAGDADLKFGRRTVNVSLELEDIEFLSGHVIRGAIIMPGAGLLCMVWETMALMLEKPIDEVPVVFRDVELLKATAIPRKGGVQFLILIQKSSGDFEIIESEYLVATGKIHVLETAEDENAETPTTTTETTGETNAELNTEINTELNTETKTELKTETKTELKTESNTECLADDKFPMSRADVYKELKLRGYEHRDKFQAVTRVELKNNVLTGKISWINNFVIFLDCLFQIKALTLDTRMLLLPSKIQKLIVNPKKHMKILKTLDQENPEFEFHNHPKFNKIDAGGFEIINSEGIAVAKGKSFAKHIMCVQKFTPNVNQEPRELIEIMSISAQLIFENSFSKRIKTIEVIDDFTNPTGPVLSQLLFKYIESTPSIEVDAVILANEQHPLITDEIKVFLADNNNFPTDQSFSLIIVSNVLNRPEALENYFKSIAKRGFLMTRESNADLTLLDRTKYNLCFECLTNECENEKILLISKIEEEDLERVIVPVEKNNYSWVTDAQNHLKMVDGKLSKKVIFVAHNDPCSGILGFFNCLLKEMGPTNIQCVFTVDVDSPTFSLDDPFYAEQLGKNLSVNVYKNKMWGTYRHVAVNKELEITTPHAYVNPRSYGDLTSLRWIQGPINPKTYSRIETGSDIVHVYCTALNFRDIMIAMRRIPAEIIFRNRFDQDWTQGCEFVGRLPNGVRVMGTKDRSLTNLMEVQRQKSFLIPIPDFWSFEEAVTIPMAYLTAIYALITVGRLKEGESVLIHSGTGGVGLAALNICTFYKCKIFTTVGTEAKREFIKKTYPNISENCIGNSRDESFEQMIHDETDGQGVDVVLNSLAEEKLLASVRCLKTRGRFLEIGKLDFSKNNKIGMRYFLNEISFHGVDIQVMVDNPDLTMKNEMKAIFETFMKKQVIKPLPMTVFNADEIEKAYRYMTTGEHIGKVLVKIREEEMPNDKRGNYKPPDDFVMTAQPKYWCNAHRTYVICGGLGGLGLELADWLVLRRAKNLVLSSRGGVTNGYQSRRISVWRSYGVNVTVAKCDIAQEQAVVEMLEKVDPTRPVAAIFNLAGIIEDKKFAEQTPETFAACVGPKYDGTANLDKISRKMCPLLEQFVVFSSVSSGVGNYGQTNYGWANSCTERLCEMRKNDGLPALAIQWGPIADVGMVADHMKIDSSVVLDGLVQEDITSCLASLDYHLNQQETLTLNAVIAEKRVSKKIKQTLSDAIARVLGYENAKAVNKTATLIELGVDSITGLEIHNILTKDFEIFLAPEEIKDLTFAKLAVMETEMKNTKTEGAEGDKSNYDKKLFEAFTEVVTSIQKFKSTFDSFVVQLPSAVADIDSDNYVPTVFILPPLEGISQQIETLSLTLKAHVFCAVYPLNDSPQSVADLAQYFSAEIVSRTQNEKQFHIIGISFGGIIALELIKLLEERNKTGTLWLIDSSPTLLVKMAETLDNPLNTSSNFAEMLMRKIYRHANEVKKEAQESDIESAARAILPEIDRLDDFQRSNFISMYTRGKAALEYEYNVSQGPITTKSTLIRCEKLMAEVNDSDYGLSRYFRHPVKVFLVEDSNHFTITNQQRTSDIISNDLHNLYFEK